MLYNPKWELDINCQRSLLQSMIGWLETQNQTTKYNWSDTCGKCLIGQWAKAVGLDWDYINKDEGDDGRSIYIRMVSGNALALMKPHTFGAALERARAAL